MKISSIPFSRLTVVLAFSLIFGSVTFAVSAINTPETGYLLCVDKKTNVVTFPGDSKCPKGSSRLQLGAKGLTGATGETGPKGDKGDTGLPGANGAQGAIGANGLTGPAGANGVNGSSILTGVGAPNNQLGNNGDTYIDKNSAQIYGPKSSGLWGYPTSFAGPAGAPGAKGEKGDRGDVGPAGQSLPASLVFTSQRSEESAALPVYNGSTYGTVLTLTAPQSGNYLVSLYTDLEDSNSPKNGLCEFKKNNNTLIYTQNKSSHPYQNYLTLNSNDVVTLRCAVNFGTGKAINSFGYLLLIN